MLLYKDREIFDELIVNASNHLKIQPEIIEKDYFVTIVLKRLAQRSPNLLFKGGTSLSKCYDIIKRFSEDIDLSIVDDFTQGNRQKIKKAIVMTCEELGFSITNLDDTKSRRDFNKYELDYNATSSLTGLKNNIYIETVFTVKPFPTVSAKVDSLIYKFLKEIDRKDIIATYELEPFEITTQSLERTFVDKVFAICDYAIDGNIKEHSRHIYDLYKLSKKIDFDADFEDLIKEVREARKPNKQCHSAQEQVNVNAELEKIISKELYKSDYIDITQKLLYEDVGYDEASQVINDIIEKNIF